MEYYPEDDEQRDSDRALVEALRQSRFPAMLHPEVRVVNWLYRQLDETWQRHQNVFHELHLNAVSEAGIWRMIASDALAMSRSAAAKKVMWSAIAMASRDFEDAHLIEAVAPLLLENVQWRPKDAVAKNIECFAGVYTPGKYKLAPLLTAAKNVDSDPAAQAFVREWLAHLALAPGVLPVQKYRAQRDATSEADMRTNTVLWRHVVVPFMKSHPEEPLFGGRLFFHLPINPDEDEGKELLQALDRPAHRQSVYANMLCYRQPTPIVGRIWEDAQTEDLTSEQRDLRLHLAMLHLEGYDARKLAERVDSASVGMLDSLGTFTHKEMAQITYSRWFDRPSQSMELPTDWFDPEAMGL